MQPHDLEHTMHTTKSDAAGIERLQAVARAEKLEATALDDALEALVQFVAEDAINACQSIPGGRGCYGPDSTTLGRLHAAVLIAARKTFAPAATPVPAHADNGLLTLRPISARLGLF
jgi:hypothetical protein